MITNVRKSKVNELKMLKTLPIVNLAKSQTQNIYLHYLHLTYLSHINISQLQYYYFNFYYSLSSILGSKSVYYSVKACNMMTAHHCTCGSSPLRRVEMDGKLAGSLPNLLQCEDAVSSKRRLGIRFENLSLTVKTPFTGKNILQHNANSIVLLKNLIFIIQIN